MKSLRDLQLMADARRGDVGALDILADRVTTAVRKYRMDPTVHKYHAITDAVVALRGAERRANPEDR
jgi:hypothetical protein